MRLARLSQGKLHRKIELVSTDVATSATHLCAWSSTHRKSRSTEAATTRVDTSSTSAVSVCSCSTSHIHVRLARSAFSQRERPSSSSDVATCDPSACRPFLYSSIQCTVVCYTVPGCRFRPRPSRQRPRRHRPRHHLRRHTTLKLIVSSSFPEITRPLCLGWTIEISASVFIWTLNESSGGQ